MISDLYRLIKLFTDDQYVIDHLYEEVYPGYVIPYYTVPCLTDNGEKNIFPAINTKENLIVEMIDYTKMFDHPIFLDYCDKYMKDRGFDMYFLIQNCCKRYITNNFQTISIITDPSTLQTNVRKVVNANLAAFSKLNLMLTEKYLIDQINSV